MQLTEYEFRAELLVVAETASEAKGIAANLNGRIESIEVEGEEFLVRLSDEAVQLEAPA